MKEIFKALCILHFMFWMPSKALFLKGPKQKNKAALLLGQGESIMRLQPERTKFVKVFVRY